MNDYKWTTRQTLNPSDSLATFYTPFSPNQMSPASKALIAVIGFKSRPSFEFTEFYSFLKKERSEENLDLWIAIRNHCVLFRRYKDLKNENNADFTIIANSTNNIEANLIGSVGDKDILDVSDVFVDRKMVRKSAKEIYLTFLSPGSPKEANVPFFIVSKVRERILREKRCDPAVFQEVRDCVYDLLSTDCFPRFLRNQKMQSLV